jgi:hypothetical protein
MARIGITQTGTLSGTQLGTNDILRVSAGPFYGDAYEITDSARGGNDKITSFAGASPVYGDAYLLSGTATGGNDNITGLSQGNMLYGDANTISGSARGGNDVIRGNADAAYNILTGDALEFVGSGQGGDDVLVGGRNSQNELTGDAWFMYTGTTGGDDTITGGDNAVNTLYGDCQFSYALVQCGDDVLKAGKGGQNTLYGDGFGSNAFDQGGNDVLISSTGNDLMYGDWATADSSSVRGSDVFVFGPKSGQDTIGDFRSYSFGEAGFDRIDVSGYGITSLAQLQIYAEGVNTVIAFGGGNKVTLLNFDIGDGAALSAGDFIFA